MCRRRKALQTVRVERGKQQASFMVWRPIRTGLSKPRRGLVFRVSKDDGRRESPLWVRGMGKSGPFCAPEQSLGGSAWSPQQHTHPVRSRGVREWCVCPPVISVSGAGLGDIGPGGPQRAKAFEGHATPRPQAAFQIGFLWRSLNSKVANRFLIHPRGSSFLPASSALASCHEPYNPAQPYNLV